MVRNLLQMLLAALCASVLILSSCSASPAKCKLGRKASQTWDSYKRDFNKNYSPKDDQWRRELYEKELARVTKHNEDPTQTYKLGIDFMSDWTETEFERTIGPYSSGPKSVSRCKGCEEKPSNPFVAEILERDDEVPCEIDWRKTAERVGRVKFQLGCGACWAFAATGLLEGQQVVRDFSKHLIELSEQQLIDCKKGGDGCGGGFATDALDYVAASGGIMSERDYPYIWTSLNLSNNSSNQLKPGQCRVSETKPVMSTKGFANLPTGAACEHKMAAVVARYGPIAASMNLKFLRGYQSGIITAGQLGCGKTANHEILIVGYGTENGLDYWLVKNSWSSHWGEQGYFKIERGKNACFIAEEPIIATF